jgi:hypothetical protein
VRGRSTKKKHHNGAKNGIIPSTTRLSRALRYFARGRPEDISLVHGNSFTEVFRSVWKVVNAVNRSADLRISFPTNYKDQCTIAARFDARSKARFSCCIGAIDGMLIWIEKPYETEAEATGCGVKKLFCGRKKKFGLNI